MRARLLVRKPRARSASYTGLIRATSKGKTMSLAVLISRALAGMNAQEVSVEVHQHGAGDEYAELIRRCAVIRRRWAFSMAAAPNGAVLQSDGYSAYAHYANAGRIRVEKSTPPETSSPPTRMRRSTRSSFCTSAGVYP